VGRVTRIERFSGVKRVNYFDGQILSPEDFRVEQAYLVAKRHRLNRALFGCGIVAGLTVAVNSSPSSVTVQSGLAIDADGREIELTAPVTLDIPASTSSPQYAVVEYIERDADAVASPSATSETIPSRIEEGAAVRTSDQDDGQGVALGRIVRTGSGWRIDHGFKPSRCR
jgi:hypothetical protein